MYMYLKNKFVPINQACISIEDRGFRFGDGIFDTIRVTSKEPYQLMFHLSRLECGLKAIKIDFPRINELEQLIFQLIEKNQLIDGFVRIYITRGEGGLGYLPKQCEPNLYIETTEQKAVARKDADVFISSYKRISKDALPVSYKIAQGMNSSLARIEAHEEGCFEALLLNEEGYISDCSSSSIFLCKGNKLITPSLSSGALIGSMRAAVIRLASPHYIIEERYVSLGELFEADAAFLTNVAWLILPINRVVPLDISFNQSKMIFEIDKLLQNDLKTMSLINANND